MVYYHIAYRRGLNRIYYDTISSEDTVMSRCVRLERPERFSKPHIIPKDKLEAAAKAACAKLKARVEKDGAGFPGTCSVQYSYNKGITVPGLGQNRNWESGMYTGCFWLAYELTGDEFFKNVALNEHLPTYAERFESKRGLDDHDVGFVYMPGCVSAYKLTGDESAKETALKTFDYYYNTSYSKDGKFIIRCHTSWRNGEIPGYRTMMDSLMNVPFFFWAAETTGNKEYYQAALDHVLTTEKYLIRCDGSSYHHYQFDPVTSEPLRGVTLQGFSNESCWSRGHAWGVYGFPIAYSYTKEPIIKEVHRAVTYFMLNHLPDDCIPYWDYNFVCGAQPRDSSAACINACGLHEMCRFLDDDDKDKAIFESAGAQMLEAVIDNCTGNIGTNYDGLICHVTHAKPQGQGVDECAIYGDYFYLEALLRYLKPDWKKYW